MSAKELDGEIETKLSRFDEALDSIESKVVPFLKKPVSEMVPRLTPTENAKLNMTYSYALNALYYMLLKCQGVQPNDHPVKKDLDRVKRYMAKTLDVDKALKAKSQAQNASKSEGTSSSTTASTLAHNSKPTLKAKANTKAMTKSKVNPDRGDQVIASKEGAGSANAGEKVSSSTKKSPEKKRKQVVASANKKKGKKKKRRKK